MKKIYLVCILFSMLGHFTVNAQSEDGNTSANDLYETARAYVQKADYANAIMVYHQAIQLDPQNLIYRRDLAHAYYLQGDMINGEKIIKPLLKADDADADTYLIACRIYTKMRNTEDAKEAINKGISLFPNSGILYEQKGQLYAAQKKYKDAAEAWEMGVKNAPDYYLNYYNLTKAYFFNKKYLWAILYGEHFVNMESFSSRSEEIKKIIYESYKFYIAELNNAELDKKDKNLIDLANEFDEACKQTFNAIKNVVTGGINTENLTMFRIRFLLEWNKNYAKKFPLELFDYQHKLILQGYYDCYNQWLFGRLDNEKGMVAWTQKNAALMNKFDSYFRANKLQPKLNQYYQK